LHSVVLNAFGAVWNEGRFSVACAPKDSVGRARSVFSDSLTQGAPAKQCASTGEMRRLKIKLKIDSLDQNRLQSIEEIEYFGFDCCHTKYFRF
jgi:hypothetical protein